MNTIIVLLILAGVTIAQIAGNESAPNKAVEARQKNEQGAEFDAIKVAAVSSIADGDYTLHVNEETLKRGLTGLIQEDPEDVITSGASEWVVTGNSGVQYKITNLGNVSALLTMDKATISAISVDVGSSTPLTISNADEIEDIESCSIAKVTSEGGIETEVASVAKNSTTGIWEITGVAVPGDDDSVTTTLIVTGKSGATKEVSVTVKKPDPPKRGDYIILNSKAIKGETTASVDKTNNDSNEDDWIILYDGRNETADNDKKGLFVIMSNYLPNAYKANNNDTYGVAKNAGLSYGTGSYATYGVYGSSQSHLVNRLKPTDETNTAQAKKAAAWKSLISSDILTAYPTTKVFGALDKATMDKIVGKKGNGNPDYYLPRTSPYQNTNGYWLASPYPSITNYVYYVSCGGSADSKYYDYTRNGVCPVVILPSDIQIEKNANGVWKVVIPQTGT